MPPEKLSQGDAPTEGALRPAGRSAPPAAPPCQDTFAFYASRLWPRRYFILATAVGFALAAVGGSYLIKDVYRADVLLSPVESKEVRSGLQNAFANLGGLASVAGISLPGGGDVEENLAVLKSREFLFRFVEEEKLLPLLFADAWDSDPGKRPGPWDAYRLLTNDVLTLTVAKKSPLVTLTVEWRDSRLAAEWGNRLVARLNDHLRQRAIERSRRNLIYLNKALDETQSAEMRQTLFTLIAEEQKQAMLAATQEEFAFRVIDPAAPPDVKAYPKRGMIGILAAFAGGMTGILISLLRGGRARGEPSS